MPWRVKSVCQLEDGTDLCRLYSMQIDYLRTATNVGAHFYASVRLRWGLQIANIANAKGSGTLFKGGLTYLPDRHNRGARPLRASIPLKAIARTESGTSEIEGRLETIAEGEAQICLEQPLAEGTKLELVVEFRDRRDRRICFQYEANVASVVTRRWYEMEVRFEEGVGISGRDARTILTDLFPEESLEPSPQPSGKSEEQSH